MKKRLRSRVLALGVVGTSLFAAGSAVYVQSVRAQDKPAAGQLLDRGSKLVDLKQYEEAKKVLLDIDPAQLPEDQRTKRDELLKQVDQALAKAAPTSNAFDNAKAAEDAGQLAQAAKLYQIVIDSPNAAIDLKQNARTQLALVQARQKEKAPAMKALLVDAIAAYDAGRLDEAQNALYTIQTIGIETLDWKDVSKPAKYQRLIAEKRVALAAAPAAPAAPMVGMGAAPASTPSAAVADTTAAPTPTPAPAVVVAAAPATPAAAPTNPTTATPTPEVSSVIVTTSAAPAAPATDEDLLAQTINANLIAQQQARTHYDNFKGRALDALKAGNYQGAIDAAKDAKAKVEASRPIFSDADYLTLSTDADSLLKTVNTAAAKAKDESDRASALLAGTQERQLAEKRKAEKAVQINRLMDEAYTAASHQDFKTADGLLDQVLAIDPNNNSAKFAKMWVHDKINFRSWQSLDDKQSLENVRQMIENKEEMIPYASLFIYPEDWPALSNRRNAEVSGSASSEADKRITDALERESESFSADAQGFDKVIQYLAAKMGVNITVNYKALDAANAGVDKNTPVSVDLKNVPYKKVLTTILSSVGGTTATLSYTIDDGVLTITTADELKTSKYQAIRFYDIRGLLLQTESTNNTTPPPLGLTSTITQISTGGGGGGGGGQGGGGQGGGLFGDQGGGANGQQTQAQRDMVIKSIVDSITQSVDPDSWNAPGQTDKIGSISQLNGQLIVKQTLENQEAVKSLLQNLTENQSIQISIEARLLLVSNNFLDDSGIGWSLTLPAGMLGTNAGALTIANNSSTLAASPSTGIPGSLGGGALGGDALNISGQILDGYSLNLLLRATQADKRTTTVTAPRVTIFSGQTGFMSVQSQINFISGFNQTSSSGNLAGGGAVATTPTVSQLTTGIQLQVEGTVSADHRYVLMKIQPQLANLDGIDVFVFPAPTGTTSATGAPTVTNGTGGASSSGSGNPISNIINTGGNLIEAPRVTTTVVQTMVSVPDGGTLLIGGQKLVGESEIEVGVPILSKVPGLNRLFTNRSYTKDERTLLILVRPTIIIQHEEEFNTFGTNFDTGPSALGPGGAARPGDVNPNAMPDPAQAKNP